MYIDFDFDTKTGFGVIDYKIEIQWKNNTKKKKVIESWSPYGKTKVLQNITNYKNFYNTYENYITLSFDLKLLNPQKYKILFYAETKEEEEEEQSYLTDFTGWGSNSPPQLQVKVYP